jgi:putative ABC transport system permease protein
VCSVIGLGLGVLLALGFSAIIGGGDLSTAVVIGPGTIMLAFFAGCVLTVLASMFPAWRATRVPPLAALREVAIDRSGASRGRLIAGVVLLVLGVISVIQVFTADADKDIGPNVLWAAVFLVVGAIVIGPVVASPSIRAIGAFLPRLKGVTGRLAIENAARSPKRTSATATTLVIAVGLVGFLSIFSASAKAGITSQVDRGLKADLVVQAKSSITSTFSALPGGVGETVAGIDGVAVATGMDIEQLAIGYPDQSAGTTVARITDPAGLPEVLDPKMEQGAIADLQQGSVILDRQVSENHSAPIGSTIYLRGPVGQPIALTVAAISDDPNVLGDVTLTKADYANLSTQAVDFYVYVKVADGADLATVQQRIKDATADLPDIEVLTRDQYRNSIVGNITFIFNFFTVLLLISVVIAAIGIANTLSLSIHERTRELGLLRAVGMVREQVRSAIRWESVLISVLGTMVGLVLALVLSRTVIEWQKDDGLATYSIPVVRMIVIVVLAAVVGVVASALPARRASKLNVLDAISYD